MALYTISIDFFRKMATPAIAFEGVSLDFNGKVLFQDLSFAVDRGSCTCLLGPSGCGKSTILKLVSGDPSLSYTGTINCQGGKTASGRTALMAQQDLLLPWMDVLANVLLGAKLRGEVNKELEDTGRELLLHAGLGASVHAYPATLSGGMRQRVALLRTLMENRPILLMDEPFSALDALTRIRLQNLSAQLTSSATVLLVTHDPLEALRMANRILVLEGSPVQIAADIVLQGIPPREAGDPEISDNYSRLLDLLMGGKAA